MSFVTWGNQAVADRVSIFQFLARRAGASVAITTDDRFVALSVLLAEHPKSGHSINGNVNRRKLVVPRFPFAMVYALELDAVRILRVIHTARKVAASYSQTKIITVNKKAQTEV